MVLEGVHRIAAATELGVAPQLIVLEQDDLVDADTLDWQDLQSGEKRLNSEIVNWRGLQTDLHVMIDAMG